MDLTLGQWLLQGGSTAVLLFGIFALIRGDLRTKQELAARDDAIGRLDARIKALLEEHERVLSAARDEHGRVLGAVRSDCDTRVTSIEKDRDFFRDLALRSLQSANRSTEVAARVVAHAESVER